MIAVIDPFTVRRVTAAMWPVRVWLALLVLLSLSILPLQAADPAVQGPYKWRSVAIGGGGFVTGVLFHPAERDLAYARTDVGGAYRWDARAQQWVALTDWLGADDWNLMGIDAFAVDPADPQALYLAAGTYMHERAGNAAVLRSFDRGRSFERAELPFKLGGNQLGRANGERLAVDPHDGRVLLLGSRDAGLWRSDDRGAHWARVDAFPPRQWRARRRAIMSDASRRWASPLSSSMPPAAAPAVRPRASMSACPPRRPVCMSPTTPVVAGRRWPGSPRACVPVIWPAAAMGSGI